ncbi:MAG TPA: PAS domain S-box protein [Thermoanaerobaculia bacterium]|nr:PAS domain S-box protein [Thermoanaerobaculia bacterium]
MRLLFVEDNADDVELTVVELRRFGFELMWERVETLEALGLALERSSWSLVICDRDIPGLTAHDVLQFVRERDRELPFIVVSGTLGEEAAVDLIRAGANDYVYKDRLARLGPAIERELRDVQLREERRSLFGALRRSEDRYRRIFENAPVGVAVSTPDGTLLAVNERFTTIVGQPAQRIVGRRMSDFTAGAHAAPGEPHRSERRFVRSDSEVVWTTVSVAPITTDSFEVEQLVWLVEDVTAQKQREAELRVYRAQLEEAQRIAQMGSYELDLTTGRRVWSAGLFRIFGYATTLEPDLALLDARVHPDDREHVHRTRRLIVASSDPYVDEYRVLLPGGEIRHIQDRGSFVRGEDGRATKIVGIVQDVTDARRQEDELQRRNVQQVVLANLGQSALSGEPIETLISEVADNVARLVDVDVAAILEQDGTRFRIVGNSGWNGLVENGRVLDGPTAAHSTYTVETGAPVIVEDLRAETRFTPSPFLLQHGIVSGITIPISTARTAPWGVLAALAHKPKHFKQSDVDFLRSVATVLAQALERDRVDQQLVLHAAQQSAIAELSRVALRSVDDAIEVACSIVTDVLDLEHALFFELDEDADVLRYRAGRCWAPAGEMDIHRGGGSGIAQAVELNVPVSLGEHADGILSGIAVPVASSTGRFGALTAHAKRFRTFSEADVEFVQSVANIVADAMERERARRALAVSEERHREVIEGASEVIFTISIDGVFTSLNAAFTNITGWPAADWIGRPFMDLIHPDDGERTVELFMTVLGQQESLTAELRVLGRRGTLLLEVASFPKVEEGRTAAIYGFARDVTETRRTERERQRVTRSLQLLLESTVEGIITVDLAGRCTMSNRAAAEMLGRAQDDMPGATLQTLLNGDERAAIGQIVAVARSGEVRSMTSGTFWRFDGSPFPVEYSAAPIIDAGVRIGVVISFSDISERRKLETKLEQADRLSSLGRLAATIAHEFNNVLMGISPFVEVIRRGRNMESSLDHIGRAVKRGKRITQDILRFTQPAQPVRTAIEVGPWIESVTLEARSLMPQGCSIQSRVQSGLRIDGDPSQLQQIFTNLILNARDAMPGGGTFSIEVRRDAPNAKLPFAVERPERFAHVIVRDTGSGMSDETQRHIFEPLFTTKQNGTGLGLPVTHQVVQRHGGDIFVESTLGIGTTFHIFLPLADEGAARAAEPSAELTALTGAHRVLLVEDDSTVAMGLVTLLELEGLHVDVARTGEEALLRVESVDPDVVVLDVGLPDMDGTQVFTLLSQRHPDLPIVFSTGHADRAKLDQYLERPHVSCLLKPYESSSLLTAIRDVMV